MRYLGVGFGLSGAIGGVVAGIIDHNADAAIWAGIAAGWVLLYGITIANA